MPCWPALPRPLRSDAALSATLCCAVLLLLLLQGRFSLDRDQFHQSSACFCIASTLLLWNRRGVIRRLAIITGLSCRTSRRTSIQSAEDIHIVSGFSKIDRSFFFNHVVCLIKCRFCTNSYFKHIQHSGNELGVGFNLVRELQLCLVCTRSLYKFLQYFKHLESVRVGL